MTQEKRNNIAKLIRRETCCGLMEAAIAVDKLIYALKHGPSTIMDKPRELEVTWKERIASDINDAYQLGREKMKEQILKEAVEGTAHPDDCEIWVDLIGYGFNIKDGDKIRVIVLPKED